MERFADPVVHDERRYQAQCDRADRLAALAAQPAQVPMTNEEIYAWADATQFRVSPIDFARAIEAHHGIKGDSNGLS